MPTQRTLLFLALLCSHLLGLVYLCRGDSLQGRLCREMDGEALLHFKVGLHDPANRLSSWVAGTDCCGWSGVGCDNRTGHVVSLDLRNPHPFYLFPGIPPDNRPWGYLFRFSTPDNRPWGLGGEIGRSLVGLKHLAYLDLSRNDFGGRPIPEFMGSLRQLTYLNLSYSGLGGIVPHHLGNLSRLQTLDLSVNDGDFLFVDDAGWVSRLSSLRQLNMSNVDISSDGNKLLEALNMLPSISSVNLRRCGIRSLPSSLPHVNFTTLSVLDLLENFMSTFFPEWLPNITSLKYLDLRFNAFQGRIPSAIWGMTSLQVLFIGAGDGNQWLEGELPTSVSSLCKLQSLSLWGILINGTSSDINELEGSFSGCIRDSLQSLGLRNNQLRGSFPAWLGELKRLKRLSLYGNSLQGPIPAFLGSISSLETLNLGVNNFNGCIPHSLGGLSSLEALNLGYNNLSGTIPESLGGLSSLERLYLGYNNLSGTIPESLGGLSRLLVLDVSFNHLEGTVSASHFSNLGGLEGLLMASNPLVFNISPDWVPPFKLRYADIGSCKLGPLFPTWLRLHEQVILLNLSNSGISDAIPDLYWRTTSHIDYLDLSNNQISGRLPDSLKHVSFGTFVNLRSNRLEGEVPRLSSNTEFLDISHNSFAGAIPEDIGTIMPSMEFLSLSNNSLNGSIPRSLCQLHDLQTLDLSRNYLSGKIPNCWKTSPPFQVLNLAHNALVGLIPSWLGSLSNLEFLQLNGNSLSGEFPPSLRTYSNIVILDLGDNKLTGEIPTWVAERMPSLKVLRLRSNNFTGHIPPSLSSLAHLQVIDMANNDLKGTIPLGFDNFTAMKFIHNINETVGKIQLFEGRYSAIIEVVTKGMEIEYQKQLSIVISIDLSSNKLFGSIPKGLADLTGLQSLNVSGNKLTGEITQNINALKNLESLDLSRNNLSGTIPPLMSSMTFLSKLNLSFNNFSGTIPTANQFGTFNDPSIYMGNPYLCGLPLDKLCKKKGESSDRVYKSESIKHRVNNVIWMYLNVALGFILSFWAICGTLIIHRRWRIIFFRLVDDISDQLYVFIVINVRKLRMLGGKM